MRQVNFRRDRVLLWVLLVILAGLTIQVAHAGDYHQDSQGHTVTVSITDSSGDPVSGQYPRLAVKRMTDGLWLDFNDLSFKAPTSATTLFQIMSYEVTGGFYYRVVSIDNSALVSMDCIMVVSNDDATYGFTTAENITWDSVSNLIKINR